MVAGFESHAYALARPSGLASLLCWRLSLAIGLPPLGRTAEEVSPSGPFPEVARAGRDASVATALLTAAVGLVAAIYELVE